MCDPVTATVAVVAVAGAGASYQQSYQARKGAETQRKSQIFEAGESARRQETRRQQGVLQQQKDQSQIGKRLSEKRTQMLAKFNISQGKSSTGTQAGNVLGQNVLAGGTSEVLG